MLLVLYPWQAHGRFSLIEKAQSRIKGAKLSPKIFEPVEYHTYSQLGFHGCIEPRPVILIKSGVGFDPSRHRLDFLKVKSFSKRQGDACTLRRVYGRRMFDEILATGDRCR